MDKVKQAREFLAAHGKTLDPTTLTTEQLDRLLDLRDCEEDFRNRRKEVENNEVKYEFRSRNDDTDFSFLVMDTMNKTYEMLKEDFIKLMDSFIDVQVPMHLDEMVEKGNWQCSQP